MKTFSRQSAPYAAAIALTALLLSLLHPPIDIAPLAWLALVPLIIAAWTAPRAAPVAAWAFIIAVPYWLINMFWLSPVTWPGWIGLGFYLALFWPLAVFALRWFRDRRLPAFLAAAIVFTGAEALQGWLLTGFPWRFMAHSQYRFLPLIQFADLVGAAGVTFLIAAVNGAITQCLLSLRRRRTLAPADIAAVAVVAVAFAAAIFYGRYRLDEYDRIARPGPLVAAVQTNIPQSVKETAGNEDMIFASLLEQNSLAAAAGSVLVAWPETMVMGYLNSEAQLYLASIGADETLSRRLHRQLLNHARGRSNILVGAPGAINPASDWSRFDHTNSAYLYRPDGTQYPLHYSKMHLVPFGEYVPFRHSAPRLYDLLMRFTPYDYDYNLTPGTSPTRFEISDGQAYYRFGVLICYEDVTPAVARRLAYDRDARKLVDWLVNISNDGWFVRTRGQDVLPSAELAQHTAICVFRAVENRLPILRSVNTGISCLIDSTGQIRDGYAAGSLPTAAMDRQGVPGWFADKITLDSRVSFFGLWGRWLDFSCGVAVAISVLLPASAAVFFRKRRSATNSKH